MSNAPKKRRDSRTAESDRVDTARGSTFPKHVDGWGRIRWLFPFMMGVVVPALLGQVIEFEQLTVGLQTAIVICVAILTGVGLLSYVRRPLLRMLVLGITILASVGVVVNTWSTADHRRVAKAVQTICEDGMWLRAPACYEEAIDHVASNISAYDPASWHGWNEVGDAALTPIAEIPQAIHALVGGPIVTVGTVIGVQTSGALILQLAQPNEESLAQIDEERARELLSDGYDEVIDGGIHGTTPNARVYCALRPRPFFTPREGDVLAVTGAPVAFGVVPQANSTATNQTVYMLCSSAERLAG